MNVSGSTNLAYEGESEGAIEGAIEGEGEEGDGEEGKGGGEGDGVCD